MIAFDHRIARTAVGGISLSSTDENTDSDMVRNGGKQVGVCAQPGQAIAR